MAQSAHLCCLATILAILVGYGESAALIMDVSPLEPNEDHEKSDGLNMSYHDNTVYFAYSGDIIAQYKVESYYITHGQDPDNHIYDGYTTGGNSNTLHFSVGRKGTADVAKWFHDQLDANQLTFDHYAGKLNFAFMGTLTISIGRDFVFPNIGLAQGHAGSSNNWWFGGKTCSYTGSNTVSCTAQNGDTLKFTRGGSPEVQAYPNEIDVKA